MKSENLLIFDIVNELEFFFKQYFYSRMNITPKITINLDLNLDITETASVSSVYLNMDNEECADVNVNIAYCQFLWGITAYFVICNLHYNPKCPSGDKEKYFKLMYKLYVLTNEAQKDENYLLKYDAFMREELKKEEFDLIKITTQLAVSFILAHECSHLELGHKSEDNPKEEYDADFAAFWYTIIHESHLQKFNWIIAISSVFLSFIFLNEVQDSDSHPAPYKRLSYYLDSLDVGDDIWEMCCHGLDLHMASAHCICVRQEQATWKEYFTNKIKVLSDAIDAGQ